MATNQASMARRQRERERQQKRREKQLQRLERRAQKAEKAASDDDPMNDPSIDWGDAVREIKIDPTEEGNAEGEP